MSQSFIPGTDAGLAAWAANFDARITAAPGHFGLIAPQVAAYSAARLTFVAALAALQDPATRSASAIFAKKTARKELTTLSRECARIIQANLDTTDQNRLDLGLTVRKTPPSPVPAPTEAPLIDLKKVAGYTASIRLHAGGDRRGKPVNVAGAGIWGYVGPSAPTDPTQWVLLMNTTETKVEVTFDQQPSPPAPGATVWITARWHNPRVEYGPAAEPVGTNLPGFGPAEGAASARQPAEGGAPMSRAA